MKTIRNTKLGDLDLRLVEKGNQFIGVVFSGGAIKIQIEGTAADDVWRRLHDEAGKANPKYFGYDGARTRFLHFFPNTAFIPPVMKGRSAITRLMPRRTSIKRSHFKRRLLEAAMQKPS